MAQEDGAGRGTHRPAWRRRSVVLGALAAPAAATRALGQSVPGGPVTLVVPVTPATPQDLLARLLAPFLQRRLGVPVVVENRPGASGNIGTQHVARSAPDGRTLLVQASPLVVNPSLFPATMAYDPVALFTPVAKLSTSFVVLVVRPDLPAEDARGFVAMARARPGALDYASPGAGTAQHLVMALFARAAGIELTHIPYSGSAPAVQDLVGRRVAASMLPWPMAMPLVQAGQVRVLGVAAERRWEDLPEMPTLGEAGFPVANPELWYALLGPAGMPAELVARLNAEVAAWLAEPATVEALRRQSMRPAGGGPEVARAHIAEQYAFWRRTIVEAGIGAQ